MASARSMLKRQDGYGQNSSGLEWDKWWTIETQARIYVSVK